MATSRASAPEVPTEVLTSARLTFKQHRFELVTVLVLALGLAAGALWLNWQLMSIGLSRDCAAAYSAGTGAVASDCVAQFTQASDLVSTHQVWLDGGFALLGAIAGLLSGVPLVSREIESGTAQTAWSLSASRTGWLARQIVPVLLFVGTAVTIAALSAEAMYDTRSMLGTWTFANIGLHGALLVARAFLIFGVGLLVGAILGRVLPALIVTAALAVVLVVVVAPAVRSTWLAAQPQVLMSPADADAGAAAQVFDLVYQAPDGSVLNDGQALAQVPSGEPDPYGWLESAGYRAMYYAIPTETAARWEPLETMGTVATGLVVLGTAVLVVRRRRPA